MNNKTLIGIPIFNEAELLEVTLDSLYNIVKDKNIDILAFNDGSSDSTPEILLKKQKEFGNQLIINNHKESLGYGKTIIDILKYGCKNKEQYDFLITFDADLQHNPESIPLLIDSLENNNHVDVVSCSRYLDAEFVKESKYVPIDRFLVNMNITNLINSIYNLNLTDSFSGFRGYRVCRVESMFKMRDVGYSSPIEFWINIAFYDLFVMEIPTSLIYLKNRQSRGNEIPWKERLANYLNAFKTYAWEDNKKLIIEKIESKIVTFIENELQDNEENHEGYITNYTEFWEKRALQRKTIFSGYKNKDLSIVKS